MASSSVNEALLVKALNSAKSANILDQGDTENIAELINEYFTNICQDDTSSDEAEDEDDDDKQLEENDTADSHTDSGSDSDSEIESDDEPLTEVIPFSNDEANDCDSIHVDAEKVRVQNFDCKCKIKSSSVDSCSSVNRHVGCIAQFSEDDILARRLDMKEFTEGRS